MMKNVQHRRRKTAYNQRNNNAMWDDWELTGVEVIRGFPFLTGIFLLEISHENERSSWTIQYAFKTWLQYISDLFISG